MFIVSLKLVTSRVGSFDYGRYSAQLAYVALIYSVTYQPLVQTLSRFSAELRERRGLYTISRLFRNRQVPTFLLALFGTVCVSVFGPSSNAILIIAVSMAIVLSDAYRSARISAFLAIDLHRRVAVLSIIDALFKQTLLIGAALLSSRFEWLLISYAVGSLCSAATAIFGPAALIKPTEETCLAAAKYSRPLYLLAIVAWTSTLGERVWIPNLTSMAEFGIYVAAVGLISRPILMFANAVLQSARGEIFARPHDRRSAYIVSLAGMATLGFGAVLALATWIVGPNIARVFLGGAFQGAAQYMWPLSIGYALLASSYATNTGLLAHKRSDLVLISETLGAVTLVATSVFLLWRVGIGGAAFAVILLGTVQLGVSAVLYAACLQRERVFKGPHE